MSLEKLQARKTELEKEFNVMQEKAVQFENQVKACQTRMYELRGGYTEIDRLIKEETPKE